MKSFTDIPQSEKLAEILPIKSADMMYKQILPKSDRINHVPEIGNPLKSLEWYNKGNTYAGQKALSIEEYCIPCWSLAALLSVIPEVSLNTFKDGKWNAMVQRGDKMIYEDKDNPVDACYEMIFKLKENGLL